MPPKFILLTGAPESSLIDWDASDLFQEFSPQVARFANLPAPEQPAGQWPPTTPQYAAWRSIGIDRAPLHTGNTQDYQWLDGIHGNAEFLTAHDISCFSITSSNASHSQYTQGAIVQTQENVLSQFYERSYAVHTGIASSQIQASASSTGSIWESGDESSLGIDITSILSGTPSGLTNAAYDGSDTRRPVPTYHGRISSLNEMPSAKYLTSVEPSTVTVNLIVGIISISAPREIRIRYGTSVGLVELLVGDETKSGFGINFWVPSSAEGSPEEAETKELLNHLRPQDIIGFKNVAVSSFKGKVHGQSLRRGMTRIHLLYRNRIDRTDVGGCWTAAGLQSATDPVLAKTSRVKDWVERFVAPPAIARMQNGRRVAVQEEQLPPDTQL